MWKEQFFVTNASNERLACLLVGKKPAQAGSLVIVLCHGYASSKRAPFMQTLSECLLTRLPPTHIVARFDFSGNGDSDGTFRYANYLHEAEDLRAVIEHLRSRGMVVACIVGHSKGAGVVLMYSGKYRDVRHIVNLAGRWHMSGGLVERFGEDAMRAIAKGEAHTVQARRRDGEGELVAFQYDLRAEDVEMRKRCDIQGVVRGLGKGLRVLTVHGERDEVIPVEDGRALHGKVESGRLVVVKGAGHSFEGAEERVADEIVAFLEEVP